MNETEVEISWALFFDTQYPQCVNKLRTTVVWVLYKDFQGSNIIYILDKLAWEKIEGIETLL
jgi:hypothetical protein